MTETKRFQIRDKEAGNIIDWFNTIEEVKKELKNYEKEDIELGCYTEGFYEIYDSVDKEIL